MKAYIDEIDITPEGRVIVSGQLSRTNIEASLSEHVYIVPPEDGLWGYTLNLHSNSPIGLDMMVPFTVESSWIANKDANGLRINQKTMDGELEETILFKAKKVKSLTKKQSNMTFLEGVKYEQKKQQLIVQIKYSGGCEPHHFALEWDGSTKESAPPQYMMQVVDYSDYDPCRAFKRAELRIDLNVPGIELDSPAQLHVQTIGSKEQITVTI